MYLLLAIIVFVNLFILFTGRTYLYKGLKETYLRGKSGPGIYDSLVFPVRRAESQGNSESWPKAKELIALTEEEEKSLLDLKTTSFMVVRDSTIVHEKYWGKHTESTKSNSFSAAKSFIGLLCGIALDKGYIKSFEDPITDYLDFLEPKDSIVKIRHLLAMSSGLKWNESGSDPLSDNAEAYYGSDLRSIMKKVSFAGPPGKEFDYASGNSQLLGLILTSATKMELTDFLEKYLWRKINPQHDLLWSLDHENGMEKSFCCIYATSEDYARVGQLILNKGKWNGEQIISDSSLTLLMQPSGAESPYYGLHFWRYEHPEHPAIYARGILGQYIIVIPTLNSVIVRTGHERLDKFTQEDLKLQDQTFKLHHPKDLFVFYDIALRIINKVE